ncbi:MAG: hypothetical protein QW814_00250 [Methanothrix sp.]
MKAQLAMLESIICISILAMASYTVFDLYLYNSIPMPSRINSAIFSLSSVYMGNSSISKCIDANSYTRFCNETIRAIMHAYSLTGISLSYNGHTKIFGYANCPYSKNYCIISGNESSYLCQKLCSD